MKLPLHPGASDHLLALGLLLSAMMLGSCAYQTVVDLPNWSAALPGSARAFSKAALAHATPTRFYVSLTSLALVTFALSAALAPSGRRLLPLMAAAALITNVLVTLVFVYPQNKILFFSAPDAHATAEVISAAAQRRALQWLRLLCLASAPALGIFALLRARPWLEVSAP